MDRRKFFSGSRGFLNGCLRVIALLKRYSVSPNKFGTYLKKYLKVMEKFETFPSVLVTGSILKRYSQTLKNFNERRVEIGIHGHNHANCSSLSEEQLTRTLSKAIKIFNDKSISFEGFRFPYLIWNEGSMESISKFGFLWDSSKTVSWDVIKGETFNHTNGRAYQKLLDLYQPKKALRYSAVPEFVNGFVEIPVSIPDDEALVDRLRITDKAKIGHIWGEILEKTYERGEIFTMQLHPERIFLCDKALEMVLSQARQKNPPIWIAQLGEIAKWWKEKDKFEAKVQRKSKNEFRINLSCSDRATILIKNLYPMNAKNAKNATNAINAKNAKDAINAKDAKNLSRGMRKLFHRDAINLPRAPCSVSVQDEMRSIFHRDATNSNSWFGSYKFVNQRSFNFKSNRRPVIGLAPDSSPELVSFLKQDGYITEVSNKKSDYGIYLEGLSKFFPNQKLEIINTIEASDAPLVRFWRWPNKARSALSITGDIDAITIWDFIFRLFGH